MTTQYIGARYVPVFYDGNNGSNWESGVEYEPLTIVTYLGNSYTSKKPVPATVGNPADNGAYWAATGTYNAQVDSYREEVLDVMHKTGAYVTPEMFGAVGDGVNDDTNAVLDAVESGKPVFGFGVYVISASIKLPSYFYGFFNKIIYQGSSNLFWTYGHDIYLRVHEAVGAGKGFGTFFFDRDPAEDSTAGVSYANVISADIVTNFESAFYFKGYTPHKGIQYCEIRFQRIWDVTYGIRLEAVSPDTWRAWCNDITIFGGQIGGGASHTVDYGIYAYAPNTSSPANEISDLKAYNVTFEGCTVNCIKFTNCNFMHMINTRLAEVANTAEIWVDLSGCYSCTFEGYLNFNINQIRDVIADGATASRAAALRAKNRFVFYNAQFRTNTFAGFITVESYNGQFAADACSIGRNQAFINITSDIDVDLRSYDINGFFMDGFTIIMHGNQTLTMPIIFGSLFTEMILYISQGGTNPVTVKDSDGTTTLASVTGNGKHLLKWTQNGLVVIDCA